MRVYRFAATAAVCLLLASAASARSRDHLQCFKSGADFAGASAHINDSTSVDLPGDARTYAVAKVKDLCVASSADGGTADPNDTGFDHDVLDSGDAWVFYAAKAAAGYCSGNVTIGCKGDDDCAGNGTCTLVAKFNKKASNNTSKRVVDDTLDLRFDFGKQIGILAPATINGAAPALGTEDYYKCYGVKQTKASCSGGLNDGKACKDPIVDCGGSPCVANPKFGKLASVGAYATLTNVYNPSPVGQSLAKVKMLCQTASKDNVENPVTPGAALLCYGAKQTTGPEFSPPVPPTVSDRFGNTPIEVKKPELVCNPACVEPPAVADATFNNLVLKVTDLAIGANENVGEALDVDGDTTRDNALAAFAVLANGPIGDAVDDGSLALLFSLDSLGDGNHVVSGYTSELAPVPGCAGLSEINDGSKMCNYVVDQSSLELGDSCNIEAEIQLPVALSGNHATGTGSGNTFSISFALGDSTLRITAQNVEVDATITQSMGDVTDIVGVIGGAVPLGDLTDALGQIDGECSAGSSNPGADCSASSACPGGQCNLFGSITPEAIASVLDQSINPDIDLDGVKNCVKGTNRGEVCADLSECPDQDSPDVACQNFESVSLGLKFTGIDANITGVGN